MTRVFAMQGFRRASSRESEQPRAQQRPQRRTCREIEPSDALVPGPKPRLHPRDVVVGGGGAGLHQRFGLRRRQIAYPLAHLVELHLAKGGVKMRVRWFHPCIFLPHSRQRVTLSIESGVLGTLEGHLRKDLAVSGPPILRGSRLSARTAHVKAAGPCLRAHNKNQEAVVAAATLQARTRPQCPITNAKPSSATSSSNA